MRIVRFGVQPVFAICPRAAGHFQQSRNARTIVGDAVHPRVAMAAENHRLRRIASVNSPIVFHNVVCRAFISTCRCTGLAVVPTV